MALDSLVGAPNGTAQVISAYSGGWRIAKPKRDVEIG